MNTARMTQNSPLVRAAGCKTIFTEKVSGKSTNGRTEFKRLMRAVKPGDIVVVISAGQVSTVRPRPSEHPA